MENVKDIIHITKWQFVTSDFVIDDIVKDAEIFKIKTKTHK